jgi:hypothetical protein
MRRRVRVASLAAWSSTGIASSLSSDIDDFYASAEEAEAVLAGICAEEPEVRISA